MFTNEEQLQSQPQQPQTYQFHKPHSQLTSSPIKEEPNTHDPFIPWQTEMYLNVYKNILFISLIIYSH